MPWSVVAALTADVSQVHATTRLIVAVDGPAGAGKGAVCRAVANRFDLAYLETGTIYRAVGLLALRQGWTDPDTVAAAAATMNFTFRRVETDTYRAFLDDEDVTAALRQEEVGIAASWYAALPQVRSALLAFQRQYGAPAAAILDGRDVGTVVHPNAALKIFLTASLDVRAKRRFQELQQAGEAVSFQGILAQMAERDARDSGRTHGPLVPAVDAVRIDTTHLTLEESIDRVVELVGKALSQPACTG
ncbi:MAG: (d)CMP kinase [Magnetococcales bacterium]|nr:(d)CMP kinase [Magnetococcales bacterium]